MTAMGKKWWGDPTSPDFEEGKYIDPFDDAAITRPVGAVFSENDLIVLRTLFYPFSVRFGYAEPDPNGFKRNLKVIRSVLDDFFDFELALSEKLNILPESFKQMGYYKLLHGSLVDRWNVLTEFGEYPNMLSPLNISSD